MADNLLPFAEPTPQNKFAEWTANLKHITRHCHDINTVKSDNYIGYTQVPLTLAGPLFVQGQYEEATIIAPLATTDRTLVANVDRGCKLLQACEGVGSDASMGVANDGSVQVSMGAVLSDQGCRDSLHVSTAGLHRALRAIVDSVTSASRASIVTAIFIATGELRSLQHRRAKVKRLTQHAV